MNTSTCWLYEQHIGTITSGQEHCYLCGTSCPDAHSVAKSIADTFNSHYLAQCPSSSWLCDACYWYLAERDHPDFRKMSLAVSPQSWRNWQREEMKADIERWLRDGLEMDCYLVVSLSKKKHILLQAPQNAAGSRALAIQVEEQVAHVELSAWQAVEQPFMALLALGHGKREILSGNLSSAMLRKHGQIVEALLSSKELETWRLSPLIDLYSYVTVIERGESVSDGTESVGGSPADTLSTRTRDTSDSGSSATCRVERHRQRVSEQVQDGDMEAIRGARSTIDPDVQQLALFS